MLASSHSYKVRQGPNLKINQCHYQMTITSFGNNLVKFLKSFPDGIKSFKTNRALM